MSATATLPTTSATDLDVSDAQTAEVRELIVQLHDCDEALDVIPAVHNGNPRVFSRAWKEAICECLGNGIGSIEARPDLIGAFVDWCDATELLAAEAGVQPQVPRKTFVLQHPVLSWGPDGQVDVGYGDDR